MITRHRDGWRSWAWPLRTGLMTVLVASGTSGGGATGCGGKDWTAEAIDAPVGRGSSSTGGALSHAGGATSGGRTIVIGAGGTSAKAVGGVPSGCIMDQPTSGLFANQTFPPALGAPLVFYSWTTDEQIAELRGGGPLFSRSERTDRGRGNALESLAQLGLSSGELGQLASRMSQELFTEARYAWTNPWATRMGWPGEQYGNRLIRVELLANAWIAHFDGTDLWITDETGTYVSTTEALANLTRIGAIYFNRGPSAGGPQCTTLGASGGGSGYREVILGNLAMVKRWGVGTTAIAARLAQDINTFERFQTALTKCEALPLDPEWNLNVCCAWSMGPAVLPDDYVQALAIPSDYYQPTLENISTIVTTLRSDGLVIDPYEVQVQ